ncbi:DUF3592 domain-containing protein [Streptomyces sp. NPDC001941]|uniref:DUF3592 domain-containing protein n=1 Tax=Streptomyces sp. NPDC001941 TaxID=3154659 RepID=UPI00332A90FA
MTPEEAAALALYRKRRGRGAAGPARLAVAAVLSAAFLVGTAVAGADSRALVGDLEAHGAEVSALVVETRHPAKGPDRVVVRYESKGGARVRTELPEVYGKLPRPRTGERIAVVHDERDPSRVAAREQLGYPSGPAWWEWGLGAVACGILVTGALRAGAWALGRFRGRAQATRGAENASLSTQ